MLVASRRPWKLAAAYQVEPLVSASFEKGTVVGAVLGKLIEDGAADDAHGST